MINLFKKRKNSSLLKNFDGREVIYITRREVSQDNNVNHNIVTKNGRIVLIGDEIRIISGEKDIFRCREKDSCYYVLLSGDGVTVEGVNTINNLKESYTAYYKYHRK